ncbi:MAG: dihydrolipoamide acetyltransferase family protein [Acidobacteriota bacterium]
MATEVLMPQMGESIAEGTITRWLAKVGDSVERDEPLLEISTDKVDAEIPSPANGVLLEIRRQDGETVPVNEIVGMVGAEGEETGAIKPSTDTQVLTEEQLAALRDGKMPAETAAEAMAEALPEDEPEDGEMTLEQRIRRFSSPLVRSIAKKEGVDLRHVTGSGIHGRVTKKDILAYLEQRARGELPTPEAAAPAPAPVKPAAAAAPAAAPAAAKPAATPAPATPAPAPAPAARGAGDFSVPAYVAGENVDIQPMSKIRQITAAHMVYSKATSAHVTTVFHIDMSKIARIRQQAKANFQRDTGTKLTFMPFIFQAVCKGIRKYPQLNAAIHGTDIVYKKDINLGMAVALDHGLIVPVIRGADDLSIKGLARTANDLADRARNKKLKPEEVGGGTFTITNPGVFGSLFGTPVINQPQVAILGIGTIEKRPIVLTDADGNDMIAIRTMCYFALTFDHRLIDGADADYFMLRVKDKLEKDDWEELATYL